MRDSMPAIGPWTPLDQMTPAERDALIDAMVNYDNDEAGPSHFVRGNPIYASPPDTPKGFVEKRFPDGRRQFVGFDLDGEHVIIDDVQTVSGPPQEMIQKRRTRPKPGSFFQDDYSSKPISPPPLAAILSDALSAVCRAQTLVARTQPHIRHGPSTRTHPFYHVQIGRRRPDLGRHGVGSRASRNGWDLRSLWVPRNVCWKRSDDSFPLAWWARALRECQCRPRAILHDSAIGMDGTGNRRISSHGQRRQ
ncbi:hypothetical protein FHX63_003997 [Cupriavidus plantarum]|nr:hypothetical protein [Cupriavidus plantarum]